MQLSLQRAEQLTNNCGCEAILNTLNRISSAIFLPLSYWTGTMPGFAALLEYDCCGPQTSGDVATHTELETLPTEPLAEEDLIEMDDEINMKKSISRHCNCRRNDGFCCNFPPAIQLFVMWRFLLQFIDSFFRGAAQVSYYT